MHILIWSRTQPGQAEEAAVELAAQGFEPLVWTPQSQRPTAWCGQGDPGDGALIAAALLRCPDGLVTLPLDQGYTAWDGFLTARALLARPEALAVAAGPAAAGLERFASRLYNAMGRVPVADLYAGLAGWPATLIASPAARTPADPHKTLYHAKLLGIPVQIVPVQPRFPRPALAAGLVWRDIVLTVLEFIKYSGSSLMSFGVDYGLFALINTFLLPVPWHAGILARVFSSLFNFTVNRTLVFTQQHRKPPLIPALACYYALAGVIAAASTGLLYVGNTLLGLNQYAVKLAVDLTLFVVSYIVQKEFIFYRRHRAKG